MEDLAQEYKDTKVKLLEEGFNVGDIFDAEIPTATTLRRKETEDEQVKALVDRKGGFLASSIYTIIGTMCVTSSAVLKAQRMQLEQQKKVKENKAKKKNATHNKRFIEAQVVRGKHERGEKLTAVDLKTIVMYVLPLTKSTDAPSRYSTKDQSVKRLEELPNPWWTYVEVVAAGGEDNDDIDIDEVMEEETV